MNKLSALIIIFLLTGMLQITSAQTSVSNLQATAGNKNITANFIDGISFTPDGILQTTESGGSKSIKIEEGPVVNKSNVIAQQEEPATISFIEKFSKLQFKYAMMLGVDVESLKNLSLFGFIDNWFGTRYRMGGTSKEGVDCSALTSNLLLAVYGFIVPRTARQQYKVTQHVKKNELKEGDLVFFNTHGGVSHVGLYLANNYFVHSCSSHGVTVSSLDDGYYSKRFICGGRVEQD